MTAMERGETEGEGSHTESSGVGSRRTRCARTRDGPAVLTISVAAQTNLVGFTSFTILALFPIVPAEAALRWFSHV